MLVVMAGYMPALCYIFGIIFMSFLVKLRDTTKIRNDLQLKLPCASLALSVGAGPKQCHQTDQWDGAPNFHL